MNTAQIKLKNTPEQIELIKAMASPDTAKADAARETFAEFIGPIILQVLNLASMAGIIYEDWPYNEDDMPSFPLDLFYGTSANEVKVWQQNAPGGLGSSLVAGLQELILQTYNLDTAVSILEKTVRRGRLPYVAMALNRMSQELLLKQERNAWYIVLQALAQANTNSLAHAQLTDTNGSATGLVQLDDFNNLITRTKRINVAFDKAGTPDVMYSKGATDAFMSPEKVAQIRAFAYQPMNTRSGAVTTSGATSIALPDAIRQEIFENAGLAEIYGVTIHEMLEFGYSAKYNNIFIPIWNTATSSSLTSANNEVIVAVDRTRKACIRPIAQNSDNGATLIVKVDDQWPRRSGKLGWFGSLTEGRVVADARALTGLIC